MLRPILMTAALAVATVLSPAATRADADSPAALRQAATSRIDRAFAERWKRAGITPAPDASDAEFLRRVTLDLAGRIPTPGEAVHFLADRSPGRREALVDRLLASEDYARHWAAIYFDMITGREVRVRMVQVAGATAWFEQAFRTNLPLDRLTASLLTARGDLRDHPEVVMLVGAKLRGASMENVAGDVARLFLGQQIQCAQCHDHPTDKQIKQQDFAAFAAWFAETRVKQVKTPEGPRRISLRVDDVRLGFRGRPAAQLAIRRVTPSFFGKDLTPVAGERRRDVVARAIVSSPLFARTTVNRTWARLFGRGLVEPWDDLGREADARQPPLLRELGDLLGRARHDHRWLLKVIVLSTPYGRSSVRAGTSATTALEEHFAIASVRPLTADQLFRSLMVATGIERLAGTPSPRPSFEKRRLKALREYLFTFDDDEGAESDSFTGSIPQALLLRNGDLTNEGARALPGAMLGRILAASSDPAQRLEWLFLTAYARTPAADERSRYLAYLHRARNGEAAYEDLFHALLTSTEFITNH